MSFPEINFFFANKFLSMHVTLSPDLSGGHLPLISTRPRASKGERSKDTDISETRVAVEEVSACLLIYEDNQLFLDKDIKLKWQEVNEEFAGTFGEDLKDHQVYVNIQKSNLYWIACRYPVLPCVNIIH